MPLALFLVIALTMWGLWMIDRPAQPRITPNDAKGRQPSKVFSNCGCATLLMLLLVLLCGVALGPIGPGNRHPAESAAMVTTRTIALAMFQYANDHDGQYPAGKSSTEVFQKLLDGNYVSDPAIFFVPLPGKIAAKPGAKLKPENVAFDVTSGIDANSPDTVPLVFLTGFRMDYHAGAPAVSLVKPFPAYRSPPNAWFSWTWQPFDGLPVAYVTNNAFFRMNSAGGHPAQFTPDGYGIVPNVMAPDFNAHGQTYRQLTPDGVLK